LQCAAHTFCFEESLPTAACLDEDYDLSASAALRFSSSFRRSASRCGASFVQASLSGTESDSWRRSSLRQR